MGRRRVYERTVSGCVAVAAAVVAACSGGTGATQNGGAGRDGGAGGLLDEAGSDLPGVTATNELAPLLEPIRAKYELPALSAVVLRGADVAARGAVGVRKLGDPTKVTLDDRFHLGGGVQTLTATLAATLVQDGHLTWDTTLSAALQGFSMHAGYMDVTLADLLAQRGGAPAVIPAAVVAAARRSGEPRALREEAARAILAAPPEASRDTFDESDASFLLAAVMMEHVMSASWELLTQARVYDRLDMRTCGVVVSDLGAAPTVPWGHVVVSDVASPVWPGYLEEPPPAFAPTQGVRCSLGDWSKLVALHLAGARGATTLVLQPPSFDELQRPVDATHARGWYAVSRSWAGAGLALNYGSRDATVRELTWVLPAKNLALIVAMNQGGKAAENAADETIGVLVGAYAPPD